VRKKTLHFTFEIYDDKAVIEVTDPETGKRVVREEACSLYWTLKGIGDPRSLAFDEIMAALKREET
jgi:hypothetical protein